MCSVAEPDFDLLLKLSFLTEKDKWFHYLMKQLGIPPYFESKGKKIDIGSKINAKVSSRKCDHITLITIQLKAGRGHQPDDPIYLSIPILQQLLPRALSVTFVLNAEKNVVNELWLAGNRKFFSDDGRNCTNEDEEDTSDTLAGMLEKHPEASVFSTVKLNGKQFVFSFYKLDGLTILIFGSKNMHFPIVFDPKNQQKMIAEMKRVQQEEKINLSLQIQMFEVFLEKYNLLDQPDKLIEFCCQGFSFICEYLDSKHFVVQPDGRLSFEVFACVGNSLGFKQMNGKEALETAQSLGLATTIFREIKSKDFPQYLASVRFHETEGEVTYLLLLLLNGDESATAFKIKSFAYSWKRIMRELLKKQTEPLDKETCDAIMKEFKDKTKNAFVVEKYKSFYIELFTEFVAWIQNKGSIPSIDFGWTEEAQGFGQNWKNFIEENQRCDDFRRFLSIDELNGLYAEQNKLEEDRKKDINQRHEASKSAKARNANPVAQAKKSPKKQAKSEASEKASAGGCD
jgi:hypothetical protein